MSNGHDVQAVSRAAVATGRPRSEYGSDVIVDLMEAYEIEYAALNPGATFRGLHDSIVNYGGNTMPQIILCNHEEIAVAVAQGYGKATGRPMVAIVHNVVGLLHAAMAIYTAWLDRAPVLVMGGTGPMAVETRRPWIDWIHTALVQGNAIRDYVKWDDQPASLQGIVESFIRGYRITTTEPQGPTYLCWDAALQEQRLESPVAIPDVKRYAPPSLAQADPSALDTAARWLIQAENPVILADYVGRNPAAVPPLIRLAENLATPVVDLGSRLNFPNTHPLDLTGAEADLLPNADVVLALDVFDIEKAISTVDRTARIPRSQLKSGTRLIHISFNDFMVRSWAQEHGRLQPIDLPIAADTSLAIPALADLLRQGCRTRWRVPHAGRSPAEGAGADAPRAARQVAGGSGACGQRATDLAGEAGDRSVGCHQRRGLGAGQPEPARLDPPALGLDNHDAIRRRAHGRRRGLWDRPLRRRRARLGQDAAVCRHPARRRPAVYAERPVDRGPPPDSPADRDAQQPVVLQRRRTPDPHGQSPGTPSRKRPHRSAHGQPRRGLRSHGQVVRDRGVGADRGTG